MTPDDAWESIHGDSSRIFVDCCKMPHYHTVVNGASLFWAKQTKKTSWPLVVSEQILRIDANDKGQYLHLDSIAQYVVALVPLHRCRSTLIANAPYVNTGKVTKGYEQHWTKYQLLGDMLNAGDVLYFFSNTPHAGNSALSTNL